MGLSGLVGAGATDALDEIIQSQLEKKKFAEMLRAQQVQEQQRAQQMAQQQSQFDQELQIGQQRANTEEQRYAEQEARLRDAAAAANERGAYEGTARSNMSELLNDPTQLAAFSMASGVGIPSGVMEMIKPRRVPLTKITVRGSNGPVAKGVTDEELAAGVEEYREPKEPKEPKPPREASISEELQLRRMFNTETQSARTVVSQVGLMREGLKAARQGNAAAGHQAVLVTFQKILDPTSVVRESEYARSAEGQSMLSRIEGSLDKLSKGGSGVPLAELEQFGQLAEQFAVRAKASAEVTKRQIDAIARKHGIDASNITRDVDDAPSDSSLVAPLTPGNIDLAKQPAKKKFKILGVK